MGEQKFFVTAAFPYALPFDLPELYTRLRSFIIADVYARYNRLMGKEVLYPMGFHYSGTPILSFYEELKKGNEEALKKVEKLGIDANKISSAKDLADAMAEKIKELLNSLEVDVDWDHSFTTEDPGFKSFVKWIFTKLKEKGYIEKGEYPVPWDPVEEMPVSHHDTKGFVLPKIGSFYLLLFEISPNTYLPASLRPETVLGVTNLWINAKGRYVKVDVGGKQLIVSEKAAFKLRHQLEGVIELERVDPLSLIGKRALNPVTLEKVPILPSSHVDPNKGTGVVASTPAHNVYDYLALKALLNSPTMLESYGLDEREIKPKKVIEVPGEEDLMKKLLREEDLEEANRRLVLIERSKGRLKCSEVMKLAQGLKREEFFKGILHVSLCEVPLSRAAEVIKEATLFSGIAMVMYDITNGPIYSRFGNEVVVKVLKDQWFLNYDDPKWKERALEALGMSDFIPRDAKRVVGESIRNAKKRAFTANRGLGTPLPWEEGAIIDSLSDSTIYFLFYPLAPKLRDKELPEEAWDYLILGKGSPKVTEELRELRKEFLKWTPLDMRVVHEDLLRSHVTYMYFHHSALLPPTQVPKRVVVTGPVESSLDPWEASSEALRLILLTKAKASSPMKVEKEDLEGAKRFINSVAKLNEVEVEDREEGRLEAWLTSWLAKAAERVRALIEQGNVRDASLLVTYKMMDIAQRYLERVQDEGLKPSGAFKRFLSGWGFLLQPFLPRLAEELGAGEVPSAERNLEAEAAETYFDILLDTLKPYKGKAVTLYVASPERVKMLKEALEALDEGVWEDLENLPKDIVKEAFSLESELRELVPYIDEERFAKEFSEALKRKLGLKDLKVVVSDEVLPLKPLARPS